MLTHTTDKNTSVKEMILAALKAIPDPKHGHHASVFPIVINHQMNGTNKIQVMPVAIRIEKADHQRVLDAMHQGNLFFTCTLAYGCAQEIVPQLPTIVNVGQPVLRGYFINEKGYAQIIGIQVLMMQPGENIADLPVPAVDKMMMDMPQFAFDWLALEMRILRERDIYVEFSGDNIMAINAPHVAKIGVVDTTVEPYCQELTDQMSIDHYILPEPLYMLQGLLYGTSHGQPTPEEVETNQRILCRFFNACALTGFVQPGKIDRHVDTHALKTRLGLSETDWQAWIHRFQSIDSQVMMIQPMDGAAGRKSIGTPPQDISCDDSTFRLGHMLRQYLHSRDEVSVRFLPDLYLSNLADQQDRIAEHTRKELPDDAQKASAYARSALRITQLHTDIHTPEGWER